MLTFRFDEQMERLLPGLSEAGLQLLEENLARKGCLSPLVVWRETGILLDGHKRGRICLARNIPFETVELSFPSREEAETWVVQNALARRQLTPFQRVEWRSNWKS